MLFYFEVIKVFVNKSCFCKFVKNSTYVSCITCDAATKKNSKESYDDKREWYWYWLEELSHRAINRKTIGNALWKWHLTKTGDEPVVIDDDVDDDDDANDDGNVNDNDNDDNDDIDTCC